MKSTQVTFVFTLTFWSNFKLINSKDIKIKRSCKNIAQQYLYKKYSPSYCELDRIEQ